MPRDAPRRTAAGVGSITIAGRPVGAGAPLFVIAEIGLNHGGSPERALALVDAAAAAGASAVKLQTLVATELVAPACPAPAHVRSASLSDFFRTFELDEEAHRVIAHRARCHGLAFIATPLSERAVDLLERVGADALKIASGDLTWPQLIERCARTGKPLILSSGMATLDEVTSAVARAQAAGAAGTAVLHCVSAYPVPQGCENLKAITTLAASVGVPVGLSDHAEDTFAVPIAVTLGAALYERHIVLHAGDGAIDAPVSSTPAELRALIEVAQRTRMALGSGAKECSAAEAANLMPSRRGLYASKPLPAGHVVTRGDVIALRPATDLAPDSLDVVVGITLTRAVAAGDPFQASDLAASPRRRGWRGVA